MDDSDIDGALLEESELTDFEYSGSEYVPSGEDINSDDGSSDDEEHVEVDDFIVHNVDLGLDDDDDMNDNNETPNVNIIPPVPNRNRPAVPAQTDTWDDCTLTVRQYPFIGNTGIRYDFDVSSPSVIFEQFVTDDVLNFIVNETNRFAHQILASAPVKRRSIMRNWLDCTPTEMKKFLGIMILMGLTPIPKMRMYWSANDLYENKVIKQTMTRDRFDMILKCWHFHNNEEVEEEEPRLAKIKTLVNMINERCKAVMYPGESIVVDESMIPWRGRLILRQYNPQKAHKYGVKLYKLCSTNGYVVKMKIYAGKDDLTGNKGHAQKVVEHLVHDLLSEGRILYADNFYNSIPLAESLLAEKTYLCGTIRSDRRGTPKDFVNEKINKGEVQAKENSNGVKLIKWYDKRRVLMVSTRAEDAATLIPTGKRNRNGEPILKPNSVIAYNQAKKGVDLSDQLSSYYSPLRKTTKWYKKVALELLLGTCVVNSFIIFNDARQRNQKWEIVKFREVLLRELIKAEDAPVPPAPQVLAAPQVGK